MQRLRRSSDVLRSMDCPGAGGGALADTSEVGRIAAGHQVPKRTGLADTMGPDEREIQSRGVRTKQDRQKAKGTEIPRRFVCVYVCVSTGKEPLILPQPSLRALACPMEVASPLHLQQQQPSPHLLLTLHPISKTRFLLGRHRLPCGEHANSPLASYCLWSLPCVKEAQLALKGGRE